MDEEDGRRGPLPGHIIGNGPYSAEYGARQQDGFPDPDGLKLMDVTGGRAHQPGRVDVLTDASMMPLCSPFCLVSAPAPDTRTHIRMKENCHENVPGK
jgi:hypothetical protein